MQYQKHCLELYHRAEHAMDKYIYNMTFNLGNNGAGKIYLPTHQDEYLMLQD